ncbi:MAG: class II fructose-bisphosphate aldolase, partial [Enterobacteriaceae bacterium]
QQTGTPLVLHGGSGISDSDFHKAIGMGIRKINFYTGASDAALAAIKQNLHAPQTRYDTLAETLMAMEQAITQVVIQQMRIFGSAEQTS